MTSQEVFVYVNRKILGCLVSFSVRHEKAVDIKKALQYPLSSGPLTDIPSTYEDLAWRVIKQVPTGYNRADIVADTYRPVSIKMQERDGQGRPNRIIINSVKSRPPCDFADFLSNGENKSKLISLNTL